MTISTTTRSVTHVGDGSTVEFPFNYPVFDSSHLVVTKILISDDSEEILVEGVDYDCTVAVDFQSAEVELYSAPSALYEIEITRHTTLTQPTDLRSQGPYLPETVERTLDRLECQIQDVAGDGAAGSIDALEARVAALEALLKPYIVSNFFSGAPGNSALMIRHDVPGTVVFAAGLSSSVASAGTAATGSTVLTIKKNGSSVGTITFGAGQSTGVFAMASQQSFASGDVLSVHNQGSADATLADISFSIRGTRSF